MIRILLAPTLELAQSAPLDLDTVGGCGRVMGHPALAGRHARFWELAAFIDVAGPHRLADARRWDVAPSARIERELYAYWAWSQENRPRLDPTKIQDVTEDVKRHLSVLLDIFGEGEDGTLLKAGDAFKAAEDALNENSWLQNLDAGDGVEVAVRVASQFVNHLYVTPNGLVDGVLALNPKTGAITLSWADAGTNTSADACQVMQAVFGPGAGGHKGIAGSPRGIRMTVQDLVKVLEYLQD
jgi:hypothetical protein